MAVEVQKSLVIDSKKIGIGIEFPLGRGNNGYFQSTYTTTQAVKNNLKNLLLTEKGERLGNPNFGTALRQFLFEPLTDGVLEIEIEKEIENSIKTWLPYIDVQQIYLKTQDKNKDNHIFELELKYSINFSSIPTYDTLVINL